MAHSTTLTVLRARWQQGALHKKATRMAVGLALCAALVCASGASMALANESNTESEEVIASSSVLSYYDAGLPASKSELVTIQAASSGAVQSIEVASELDNSAGASTVRDMTSLTSFTDIEGATSYYVAGNQVVWEAKDNSDTISYTAATQATPPIEVSLTYTLDGEVVTPEDIVGKSGALTIRFDYTNRTGSGDVAGADGYVPFLCLSSFFVDSDVFQNIEVTNGRLIESGGRSAVVGYALPGLKGALALQSNDVDIPDYVEVRADVSDFTMPQTVTLASSGVLGEIDMSSLSTDEFAVASDSLESSMDALVEGSSTLTNALLQFASGAQSVSDGVTQLQDGASQLKDGTALAADGAHELAGSLGSKDDTLDEHTLVGIAESFDAYVAELDESASTLDEASALFAQAAQEAHSLAQQLNTVPDATATASQHIEDASKSIDTAQDALNALMNDGQLTDSQKEALGRAQQALSAADTDIDAAAAAATSVDVDSVSQIASELEKGATALDDLKQEDTIKQVQDEIANLHASSSAYAEALTSVAQGTALLAQNLDALSAGAAQLDGGLDALGAAMPALVEGAQSAAEGSDLLTSGLSVFDEKGIQSLAASLRDIGALSDKMDTLIVRAKAYDTFTGAPDGVKSNVSFVIKTESVE